MKLTPKQELFVQTYIKTGNGVTAYKKAYNTKSKSHSTINKEVRLLLKNPSIAPRIKELQKQLEERSLITKEKILKELASVAFVKESEFYNDNGSVKLLSELTDEQKSALSHYSVKSISIGDGLYEDIPIFKVQDKLKAIETINKMLGFNEPDKVEGKFTVKSSLKDFYKDINEND